jgi:hypothetical protein
MRNAYQYIVQGKTKKAIEFKTLDDELIQAPENAPILYDTSHKIAYLIIQKKHIFLDDDEFTVDLPH